VRWPTVLFAISMLILLGTSRDSNCQANAQTAEKSAIPEKEKPFSPYVQAGNFIFVSGSVAVDQETGKLINGDIQEQTAQALKNIATVLKKEKTTLENVVKTTVFLKNIEDYAAMNEAYVKFFPGRKPARSTVAVAGLTLGALIEIEAVAYRPMMFHPVKPEKP